MAEFSLEQQLDALSPEQLEELKQELIRTRDQEETPGGVGGALARGLGKSLLSGAEGSLLALQGRPISELSQPEKGKLSPDQELDIFEKKERIKAKIKQEFGGSDGMQIVQLPGGGFAVIPGGTKSAEGISEDLAAKTDASGQPLELEDITIKAGGVTGKVPKSEEQAARELEETRRGKRSESVEKSISAKRMGLQNITLVSGAARELAQTYADAVREGGMGSLGAQVTSKASLFFGGEQAEQFASTEAFPGSKTEIVARMMPLLTQQGDRPGSVRLVATIFDKLSLTLPGDKTPPKNARKMIVRQVSLAFALC